jgi:hypothetical protein
MLTHGLTQIEFVIKTLIMHENSYSWEKKKNEKHHTEYRKNNNAVNYVFKYRIRFVVV